LAFERLEYRLVLSILTVSSSADDGSPGTLRSAITQANTDGGQHIADDIYFAQNLGGDQIALSQGPLQLTAGSAVTIWSSDQKNGKPLQIIIEGAGTNLLQVDSGASLSLHGLILTNGDALGGTPTAPDAGSSGGAINNAGTLVVDQCKLVNNSAEDMGGAVYNTGSLIVPNAATFTGNISHQQGGAIANAAGGTVSLTGPIVSGNTASTGEGGALYNKGMMTVSGGALSSNTAGYDGGAIYNTGTMTVTASTLNSNQAGSQSGGGGIYNGQYGTMTVSTSTLAKNGARTGGAIYNGGTMTLSAATISGNSAPYGAGTYTVGTLTMVDTIVAGNALLSGNSVGPDVYGSVTATSVYNLIGDGSGLTGISNGAGGNKIGSSGVPIDPLLASLGNYSGSTQTMPPLPGSPALAAGGPVTTLTAAIGAQDTTVPVADAAAIASTAGTGTIQIDRDEMWVSSVQLEYNTLTVVRSSVLLQAGHSLGAAVYFECDQSGDVVQPSSLAIGAEQSNAQAIASIAVTAPGTATAGTPFNVTVTAEDSSGKTVSYYNGPFTLTSSDGQTVSHAAVTLSSGTVTVPVTLSKTGTVTLAATIGTLKGTSGKIVISAGSPASIQVHADAGTEFAGAAFSVSLTVLDTYGNTCTGDNATAVLTAGGQTLFGLTEQMPGKPPKFLKGSVAPSIVLKSGTAAVSFNLHTAGKVAIAGTQGSATGSTSITVTAGPSATITASASVLSKPGHGQTIYYNTAGEGFTLTVATADKYGNPTCAADLLAGSVTVTCNDKQTVTQTPFTGATSDPVPITSTVTLDKADFSVALIVTSAAKKVKGRIYGYSLKATSNTFVVMSGALTQFAVTAPSQATFGQSFPLTVTAEDAFGNPTLDFCAVHLSTNTNDTWVMPYGQSFTQSGKFFLIINPLGSGSVPTQIRIFVTSELEIPSITAESGPITLKTAAVPAWFSSHLVDPGIQQLAAADYLSHKVHGLTYDDMLGIFQYAETEFTKLAGCETDPATKDWAATSEQNILDDLGQLRVDGSSDLNMTPAVQYLTTQVALPGVTDECFLANYCSQNPALSVPTCLCYGQPSLGDGSGSTGGRLAAEITALVDQWFLGTILPGINNLNFFTPNDSGGSYSEVAGTLYGPTGGPLATDVNQNGLGDCWIMATMAEVAHRAPGLIENMITTNDNGTYTIRLYSTPLSNGLPTPGVPVYITVDTELPATAWFAGWPHNVLWGALMEKAFAEWQTLAPTAAHVNYDQYSYQDIQGGNAMWPLVAITGVGVGYLSNGYNLTADNLRTAFNSGELIALSTPGTPGAPELIGDHYYAALAYTPSTDKFLLMNPWGCAPICMATAELKAAANSTTVSVGVLNGFPAIQGLVVGELLLLDKEVVRVTAVGNGQITVQRGVDGTAIADHPSGTDVVLLSWLPSKLPTGTILDSPGVPALFQETASWCATYFDEADYTTTAFSAVPASATAPSAHPTSGPPLAMALESVPQILSSGPSAGSVLTMLGLTLAAVSPAAQAAPVAAGRNSADLSALDSLLASWPAVDRDHGKDVDSGRNWNELADSLLV
jgi:hypothetical protein